MFPFMSDFVHEGYIGECFQDFNKAYQNLYFMVI